MTDEKRGHVGRTIEKQIEIDASEEDVFEAWADPVRIAQWFVDRAEGRAEAGSVVKWIFETFGFEQPVPVVAAEPNEHLVIAGEIPERPPFMQEVKIEKKAGRTVLRILQSGFGDGAEWDDEYEGVDSGWEMAIATLRHWLEEYGTNDRGHVCVVKHASFEYADLQPLFDTPDGLKRWLAKDATLETPLTVGAPVRMDLGDAGLLDGRVLARTSREVLLSWPERSGVLALKCFSMGPAGRMVALDLSAWPLRDRAETEAFLTGAVDRLVACL